MTRAGMVSPNPLLALGPTFQEAPRFIRWLILRGCGIALYMLDWKRAGVPGERVKGIIRQERETTSCCFNGIFGVTMRRPQCR
jgi:hypothetical protein